MNKIEEYRVEAPPAPTSLDVLASGVPIAKIKRDKNIFYVQEFDQNRIFIVDMIEGIKQHLNRNGYGVEWVIWDKEYERFEFKTFRKDSNDNPTSILSAPTSILSENPKA